MFESICSYRLAGSKKEHNVFGLIDIKLYTLQVKRKEAKKLLYIVELFRFQLDVYILKFYPKALRLSEDKFTKTLKGFYVYAPPIFRTCAEICIDILNSNTNASFGFVASEKQAEEEYYNTRFRIYKSLVSDWFPESRFIHTTNESKGFYLLVNKQNCDDHEDRLREITIMLAKTYEDIDI